MHTHCINKMNGQVELPKGRSRLATVLQVARDFIRISDVEHALKVSRSSASKLLSRWSRQGWLRRVGPGIYVLVGLESIGNDQILVDPWVMVPALYNPAYIGGRSAAEYWDLTEQIFRDTVVLTGRSVRVKQQRKLGSQFTLKHIRPSLIFGIKRIWREHTKIPVSDVHRTIVDILDDPNLGGGIAHAADCFGAYLVHDERDDDILVSYATRLGNGAVFKRMGYLAERGSGGSFLIKACRQSLTKGNAKVDPALPCRRLVTRWRLLVPETWVSLGAK